MDRHIQLTLGQRGLAITEEKTKTTLSSSTLFKSISLRRSTFHYDKRAGVGLAVLSWQAVRGILEDL